jgi:hypothetical protein
VNHRSRPAFIAAKGSAAALLAKLVALRIAVQRHAVSVMRAGCQDARRQVGRLDRQDFVRRKERQQTTEAAKNANRQPPLRGVIFDRRS